MKTTIIFSILFMSIHAFSQSFITLWDMNNSGYASDEIRLNIETGDSVKYTWETVPAGISDSGFLYNLNNSIPNIPVGSIIKLHIDSAHFKRFYMGNTADANRLLDVLQWGNIAWGSMEKAFERCYNLTISATDNPNLSEVKSMAFMFSNCTSLDGPANINTWNTSYVENMEACFMNAVIFNHSIENWHVSNVKNMSKMFFQAKFFNQPLNSWNTSEVINMQMMFMGTLYFNQPLNNWNTGKVQNMHKMFSVAYSFNQDINNWNTSNVNDMSNMFLKAYNFNQDLNNWDVSHVVNMQSMFQEAFNFNGNIQGWNTYNVLNFNGMFFKSITFNQSVGHFQLNPLVKINYMLIFSGINCINYGETLKEWASSGNVPYGKDLSSVAHYDSNAIFYRNLLMNTHNWSIFDEGVCCMPDIIITKIGNVLTANVSGAKYQWYDCLNMSEIQGETKQSFVTNNNTTAYKVRIKLGDCVQYSQCSNTMPTSTLATHENLTWEIYPNPTNSKLYIKSDKPIENIAVELYNTVGQLLLRTVENEIDVSKYASGVYYLKYAGQTRKVIIE